ncbi:outer membrane beta-barrel protein [Siccirubricoccus sp. KC 17139]|uniref:Outer membrane beta-barrel protein n=1 Tax=Siccirubricoccus soli TaxID=2899147 RepID=A0ABT1DEV2_9PROT|nr:outer membrane beta-barrel protein [Siccirubricoccus soli]MCO6419755.1 outer membrane beta-barrel protein [Siccirubricoccus soli]MCP2685890.1 outer membrane beta-barrel protein [Siccirubricoccus soli]
MADKFRVTRTCRAFLMAQVLWGALPMGAALAQDQVQGQGQNTARDAARGVTVTSRPRPDFDPLGVRLGGFRLDGMVDVGPGFDSNLFGRRNNVVSDGFVDTAAGARLRSDWTTHAVGIEASMLSRQYFNNSDLDFQDWNILGFGRYDFSADTNVEGRYRHAREHLDVFSTEVQGLGIARPVSYDTDEVSVTGNTRFNRVGLTGGALWRSYRFENQSFASTGGSLSLNDFDTVIGSIGSSYTVAPGRAVTATVRLQDISYTNAASRSRDSFTWEALLGFDYDFDGVWQARVAVGWRQRNYNGPGLKPVEGLAAEGQITWLPTQLTTVRFNVLRTIEESIRVDAVSYQRLQGGVTVDHEFLRNVILSGDIRADRREYQRPDQKVTDGILTLSARWLINRNLELIGAYSYSQRLEKSAGYDEYDRNLFQVRLRASL